MTGTLLFGGTFDPVHHGHLILAQAAKERLGLDRVRLIPARVSPHKQTRETASGEDRLAMLRLAVAEVPEFAVEDLELLRQPPSYTMDTIEALKKSHPTERFTLLLGADQLPKLHHWHRARELLEQVELAILGRPGHVSELPADLPATLGPALAAKVQAAVRAMASGAGLPLIEISATQIRARVAAGLPIHFWVPPAVEAYIRQRGLYRRPI